MEQETRDDFVIVVSVVVAILLSRVADSILDHKFSIFSNPDWNIVASFFLKLIILVFVAIIVLGLVKWVVSWFIKDENSEH